MKKFYLETYGCKLNQADSEILRGILKKNFKESNLRTADFVVINSCGVVQKTERKIIKRILELKKENKKIILAGCLSLISSKAKKIADICLGPKDIFLINKAVKNLNCCKNKKFFLKIKEIDKSKFYRLKDRKDRISAIVPISEGCLGNCSYCISKFARQKLKSFDIKNILKEIKDLIKKGYKEIQLTSQDSSVYGLDKGKFLLPQLLKKITQLEGDFKVRLGMANPQFIKYFFKDLLFAFENKKIYKFLHLPLQSGDNQVLKKMKRNYTSEEFLEIVFAFQKKFDDILIATDVIVGFPEEDKKAFKNTLNIIKKIKPTICHIFQYSRREGTESYNLKDFPERIKKERSRILTKIIKKINLERNKKFVGKIFNVLVVKKNKNGTYLARTPSFRAVILKNGKLGQKTSVKIIDFKHNYLVGEIKK